MTDATASELEILPLTPERLPDLGGLFGQGGDPKWCWCAWYRLRSVDFKTATADTNRAVLEEATSRLAAEGRGPGLIAYRDGEAIGWVSLGPRDDYQRLQHSKVLAPIDERPTWSIICFVVARRARRQGVAKVLLTTVRERATAWGCNRLYLTSEPANSTAHATWLSLGFVNTPGDHDVCGVSVTADFKGPGKDRAVYELIL